MMRMLARNMWAGAGSRRWRLVGGAVLVLALLVGGGAAVAVVAAPEPVAAAAGELAEWRGVKYRGTVTDASGATTAVTLTVAADGRAYGSFDRPSGARAQFVVSGGESLVKGNREWWRSISDAEPDSRADLWVTIPPGEAIGLASVEWLTPAGLQRDLASAAHDAWRLTGERVVDGRRGEIWSDGVREVVIGTGAGPRMLSLALPLPDSPPAPRSSGEPAFGEEETEGDAPDEPVVHLSLAPSDDGEMEALEELTGNLMDLVEKGKEAVEQAQEEDEKARRDQAENC